MVKHRSQTNRRLVQSQNLKQASGVMYKARLGGWMGGGARACVCVCVCDIQLFLY
jgi:hypothetical protein